MRVSCGSGTLAAHMVEPTLSRRAFVGISLGALAEIALGCGGIHRPPRREQLEGFIQLSRVVTGADTLPTRHARAYLEALEKAPLKLGPSELVERAGYARREGPASLDALRRSRAFSADGAQACAQAIAAAWWSGTVPERGGGQRVVTYSGALVWQAIPWANPQTECLGATGAWARPGRRWA
jgi:hypothetical protein